MRKLSTLLLALVASAGTMFAWDYERVQIDGLYYNLDATNHTAEVTYKSYSNFQYNEGWTITTANIPTSVSYNTESYSVISIAAWAFYACRELVSVVIPNTVTSIGNSAFPNCSKLVSIEIPNSVTIIGSNAFSGCSGLTSVDIPNSVTSIGNSAFHYCTGLTSVTIPNSVVRIEEYAFASCSSLITAIIGSNVTTLQDRVFENCSNLDSIIVNVDNPSYSSMDGVLFNKEKTIIKKCPEGKQGEYSIPNSVTRIDSYAFQYCSGLTSILIPNSVTFIGSQAFDNCRGLTNLTIPSSISSITYSSFSNCHSLTSIIFSNSVTSIEYTAFSGCYSLISIELPNSVTSIGSYAFSSCSGLTSVTIPNSVTTIGECAFMGCSSMASVMNTSVTPQAINSNVFANVDKSTCTLYVPKESVYLYKAADVWKEFTDIVAIPDSIETVEGDYTIYYVDKESQDLSDEVVTLHVPVAPTISGFTFVGWDVVAGHLTNGITIQAIYTADIPSAAPAVYTNPANPAQKLIRNGNVYILTEDKTYSIEGRRVK